MEMLDLLPHEMVSAQDLPALFASESSTTTQQQHQVYLLPLAAGDAFKRTDDGSFDRTDFQVHPSRYHSIMADKVIPYTNTLINCAYWDPRFPRLLTKDDMRRLYNDGNKRYVFHYNRKYACVQTISSRSPLLLMYLYAGSGWYRTLAVMSVDRLNS